MTDPAYKHEELLMNIELRVVAHYRDNPALTDHSIDHIYENLYQHYRAQAAGRNPRPPRLSEEEQVLYDGIKSTCEIYLDADSYNTHLPESKTVPVKSVDDIMEGLKRLRKSLKLFNSTGGRQGYLNYINRFF